MKPLKVALVHADHPRLMESRMVGIWSYPVPEFEAVHYPVAVSQVMNKGNFPDYDVIFCEDSRVSIEWRGEGCPVVYYVVDSSLSNHHYNVRLHNAKNVDLILVDWDRLERFKQLGVPVRRLSHCVNDRFFGKHYGEKSTDVGFFFNTTPERMALDIFLRKECKSLGYSYQSGKRAGKAYAKSLARCKVNINLHRNPDIRAHRIFDAMASHTCLMTDPFLRVSTERRCTDGFSIFLNYQQLKDSIADKLGRGTWIQWANAGYKAVQEHHTWAVRAQQLRQIIYEELGL